MADYRSPMLQIPHRKPINPGNAGLQFHSSGSPDPQHRQHQTMRSQSYQNRPQVASSSYYPNQMHQQQQTPPFHHQQRKQSQPMNPNYPARTPSNATTSTTSTGGNGSRTNPQADVRRSSSSRSGHAPIGYVALMRKQKATVWCDRAQQEDPRVVAQRRAAKQRAAIEVNGGGGRSATLVSTGKIRHNTSSRSINYNTGTMVGAGVPLRLSANEIGDAEDDKDTDGPAFHRRTGSGRSSTGSSRFPSGYQRPQQGRFSSSSNSNTPPNMDPADRIQTDIPEIVETPAPLGLDQERSYFDSKKDLAGANYGSAAASSSLEVANEDRPKSDRASSMKSDASDLEEDFGALTEMGAPSGVAAAAGRGKKLDDLKRRGSVDDRSTRMSNVRLFVANPDLSD
ncbi:conserved hypothetical protein [Histoplasma capsulatum var. duboisii H88]|uniref:Uncharacterized protein n=2 Tax=Ajellomyces capsulatus TaxID=5037 RepID=F0UQ23_AJEC8|nr:conserved hypothetical protein [Histoplasma capsulatum H143]EGC47073.1 conserved hypothetical protein [Histoplasma capsulatum var. duboisii H88]QSS53247.1 hypothetical protein I7I53_00443 [Histoplasma capsulatum var. duboisii H88]